MEKCDTWLNLITIGGPSNVIHMQNHMVNFKPYCNHWTIWCLECWVIMWTPHGRMVCHIGSTYEVTCHMMWPLMSSMISILLVMTTRWSVPSHQLNDCVLNTSSIIIILPWFICVLCDQFSNYKKIIDFGFSFSDNITW